MRGVEEKPELTDISSLYTHTTRYPGRGVVFKDRRKVVIEYINCHDGLPLTKCERRSEARVSFIFTYLPSQPDTYGAPYRPL